MPVLFQNDFTAAFPILPATLKPFSFSPAHWLPLRVQWNQYHRGKSVIRQTISCDICGADKKESNHWFVALEREGEIRLGTWAALGRRRSGARHLCGQKCLYKLVDDFFVRRALGLRPSSDLPAEVSGSPALALPDSLSTVLPTDLTELPPARPAIPPPAPRSGGHHVRPQRTPPAAARAAAQAQPASTSAAPASPASKTPVPAAGTRKKAASRSTSASPASSSASRAASVPASAAADFPDLDSTLTPPRSTRIHRDAASPRRQSAIPAARAAAGSSSAQAASLEAPAAASPVAASRPQSSRLPQAKPAHPDVIPALADEFGSSARLIPTPPDRLARHAAEAAERVRAWRPAVPPAPQAASVPPPPTQASPQQAQAADAADRRRILDAWQRELAREQGATFRAGAPANQRPTVQSQADSRPSHRSPSRLTSMLRPRILEA